MTQEEAEEAATALIIGRLKPKPKAELEVAPVIDEVTRARMRQLCIGMGPSSTEKP